jgi:hypothetical protein
MYLCETCNENDNQFYVLWSVKTGGINTEIYYEPSFLHTLVTVQLPLLLNNRRHNALLVYCESSSSSSSSSSSPGVGVGRGGVGKPTLREGLVGGVGTGTAEREGRGEGVGRTEITKERLTDGRLVQASAQ